MSSKDYYKIVIRNNPKFLENSHLNRLIAASRYWHMKGYRMPKWVQAMNCYPPTPFQPFRVIPEDAGHFIPSPKDAEAYEKLKDRIDEYEIRRETTALPGKGIYRYSILEKPIIAKKKRFEYCEVPPKIIYDEDIIRSEFYKVHPYELDRPLNMQDTDSSINSAIWWNYSGVNNNLRSMDPESVVRLTLKYESEDKLPRSKAYKRALKMFYTSRAYEDSCLMRNKELLKLTCDNITEGIDRETLAVGNYGNTVNKFIDLEAINMEKRNNAMGLFYDEVKVGKTYKPSHLDLQHLESDSSETTKIS